MTSKLDLNRAFSEHGVTSKTVAERIGLTPQTISAYVNGNPTVKSLYQIADALECDVRDLFYPVEDATEETTTPDASPSGTNGPRASALITCPHCGTVLSASLSVFNKS
jgi:transcriptional regulator with XRE-family HTH domain